MNPMSGAVYDSDIDIRLVATEEDIHEADPALVQEVLQDLEAVKRALLTQINHQGYREAMFIWLLLIVLVTTMNGSLDWLSIKTHFDGKWLTVNALGEHGVHAQTHGYHRRQAEYQTKPGELQRWCNTRSWFIVIGFGLWISHAGWISRNSSLALS